MTGYEERVRSAHQRGYRVMADGAVENPSGRRLKLTHQESIRLRYFKFNIKTPEGSKPVTVHKLQAFQKFGDSVFAPGVVVRHLDGDSLNNQLENIGIGTITDNAMDRDPVARSMHAQKAGKAMSPYSDEMWDSIRNDHASGLGYKKLRTKYGIGLSTLSFQLSKTAKWRTLANRG